MRMPTREKVVLVITFGIAILVIAVDVIRIAFLESAATSRLQDLHTTKVGEIPDEDYTCSLTQFGHHCVILFWDEAKQNHANFTQGLLQYHSCCLRWR